MANNNMASHERSEAVELLGESSSLVGVTTPVNASSDLGGTDDFTASTEGDRGTVAEDDGVSVDGDDPSASRRGSSRSTARSSSSSTDSWAVILSIGLAERPLSTGGISSEERGSSTSSGEEVRWADVGSLSSSNNSSWLRDTSKAEGVRLSSIGASIRNGNGETRTSSVSSSSAGSSSEGSTRSIGVHGVGLGVAGNTGHGPWTSTWDVGIGEGSSGPLDAVINFLIGKSFFSAGLLKSDLSGSEEVVVAVDLVVDVFDDRTSVVSVVLGKTKLFSEGSNIVVKDGLVAPQGGELALSLDKLAVVSIDSSVGVSELSVQLSEPLGEVVNVPVVGVDGLDSRTATTVKVVKVSLSVSKCSLKSWDSGSDPVELVGSLSNNSGSGCLDGDGIIKSLLSISGGSLSISKCPPGASDGIESSVQSILSLADVGGGVVESKLSFSNNLAEPNNVAVGVVESVLSITDSLLSVGNGSEDIVQSLLEDWSVAVGSVQLAGNVSNIVLELGGILLSSVDLALEVGDVVGGGGNAVRVRSLGSLSVPQTVSGVLEVVKSIVQIVLSLDLIAVKGINVVVGAVDSVDGISETTDSGFLPGNDGGIFLRVRNWGRWLGDTSSGSIRGTMLSLEGVG